MIPELELDGVLYAVELGPFPCPPATIVCEGTHDMFANIEDGEEEILAAMRARVLAFDIAPDGGLDGRRVVLADLPVANSLHAANGLEVGPDGWLYMPVGNVDRLWWAPDRAQGHTPNINWMGTVLRFDGSGAAPEVFASGLRNVYEIAFDDSGRMWGVDNDGNAHDGYRLEEVLQIKQGHRYGFPQESTFGPKTIRDDGPAWISDTQGTAGLAWTGGAGIGPGLLIGDCGGIELLAPDPTLRSERWEQRLTPTSQNEVLDVNGCVTTIEQVSADEIVAGVFSGGGDPVLIQLRVAAPLPEGSGAPTPRTQWQPPG